MNDATFLDRAGPIRPGEELNVEAVDAWLKSHLVELSGTPKVTQYSGGASNWTYRLAYPHHDLILRRPPAGTKARSAHDMDREYHVQKAIKPVFPYVPDILAYCQDETIIGAEFYVMRRIPGIIPRANMPKGINLTPDSARALCISVIDRLIELHQVDIRRVGLESLGKGPGYAKRQIEGWIGRYEKARTRNVPSFKYVIDWLRDSTPDDVASCLIHNDYRLDNVILDPKDPRRVIGVLDWEMATIGDPLMDLGNSMAYRVQADDDIIGRSLRRQATHLPGMLTRREAVDYYCHHTGQKPDNWPFYEVYGLFRLAVILQQIYYRYHHGQTRNQAFKRFWLITHYLHFRCRRIIKKGCH